MKRNRLWTWLPGTGKEITEICFVCLALHLHFLGPYQTRQIETERIFNRSQFLCHLLHAEKGRSELWSSISCLISFSLRKRIHCILSNPGMDGLERKENMSP